MNTKDLLCNTCSHEEVCALKAKFQEIIYMVESLKTFESKPVNAIPWIEPITVKCRCYDEHTTVRHSDIFHI